MCTLIKASKETEVIGYKVVAKNTVTGKYYSFTMGFQYKSPMTFTKLEIQNRLTREISNRILEEYANFGFAKDMVGRSACFRSLKDAEYLYMSYKDGLTYPQFKLVIVKVKMTNDLMSGTYCMSDVVAGRTMEILKEVK